MRVSGTPGEHVGTCSSVVSHNLVPQTGPGETRYDPGINQDHNQ